MYIPIDSFSIRHVGHCTFVIFCCDVPPLHLERCEGCKTVCMCEKERGGDRERERQREREREREKGAHTQ